MYQGQTAALCAGYASVSVEGWIAVEYFVDAATVWARTRGKVRGGGDGERGKCRGGQRWAEGVPGAQERLDTHWAQLNHCAVQPPQYRPPQFWLPPHRQPVYPYTHTPYYPPPQHPQPQAHVSLPAVPTLPVQYPSFTSVPLMRDLNKLLSTCPTLPPVLSSHDDPNAMPSYKEMIFEAIIDVREREGMVPKVLFAWMAL